MRTIISSSAGGCVLIILFQLYDQLYGSKAGPFKGNLFWMDQYDSPQPSYWKKN